VAILVYARTASRQSELAVRSALGASRGRIVAQLFTEALVLASVAALAAMVLLATSFRFLQASIDQLAMGFPFWLRFDLSTAAVAYVVGFTLIAAAIVGIVPALKATGRRVHAQLQGLSAGSGSGMHMGRLWTLLIVVQVGIAVAILPATVYYAWWGLSFGSAAGAPPIDQFLSARLVVDRPSDVPPLAETERAFRQAYAATQAEVERRVASEGQVAAATFSATAPGGELAGIIEGDEAAAPGHPINYNIVEGLKHGHLVRFNRVGTGYFDAFDVPLLMGRGLGPQDTGLGAPAVVVDRTFVDQVFGGQNPLGRRFRYVGRSREAGEGNMVLERWHEIVGVVETFPPHRAAGEREAPRVFHAAAPGEVYPAWFAVRVRGEAPQRFANRLRELAADVDPALQLQDLSSTQETMQREQGLMRLIGATLVAVMAAVVSLAAAGIYALMSLTVARRRKEIGIRAALGADPGHILIGIFSRAFAQLAAGAVVGIAGAIVLEGLIEGEMFRAQGTIILPAVALLMTFVGLLAALGPARRGLRIQPTEALRED
jgi:putative ABC transport system permease protein